ncbi:hypothetical protein [Candidatus Neoehrlichia procyonis]|uniref:Uncharacterized protein n=1 Tax=Candidatus Neoehrlichia procyonis str. RAC413 TaxID=1359163 RepID=A0A0F3NNN6_9RICK|nr:hypothetical protein [Candidatus Neoehrlichia lotoris]KJV69638.1 hypothetical protein NLO413_1038 [Candidatus Neoehrlichia lotoris str. RAC413]
MFHKKFNTYKNISKSLQPLTFDQVFSKINIDELKNCIQSTECLTEESLIKNLKNINFYINQKKIDTKNLEHTSTQNNENTLPNNRTTALSTIDNIIKSNSFDKIDVNPIIIEGLANHCNNNGLNKLFLSNIKSCTKYQMSNAKIFDEHKPCIKINVLSKNLIHIVHKYGIDIKSQLNEHLGSITVCFQSHISTQKDIIKHQNNTIDIDFSSTLSHLINNIKSKKYTQDMAIKLKVATPLHLIYMAKDIDIKQSLTDNVTEQLKNLPSHKTQYQYNKTSEITTIKEPIYNKAQSSQDQSSITNSPYNTKYPLTSEYHPYTSKVRSLSYILKQYRKSTPIEDQQIYMDINNSYTIDQEPTTSHNIIPVIKDQTSYTQPHKSVPQKQQLSNTNDKNNTFKDTISVNQSKIKEQQPLNMNSKNDTSQIHELTQPTSADSELTLERPSSSANSQNFYKQLGKLMTKEQQPLSMNGKNNTPQIHELIQPTSADSELTLERPSSSANSQNFYKQLGKSMTKEQQPLSMNGKNNTPQIHNPIQSTSADVELTLERPSSSANSQNFYKQLGKSMTKEQQPLSMNGKNNTPQIHNPIQSTSADVLNNITSKNSSSKKIAILRYKFLDQLLNESINKEQRHLNMNSKNDILQVHKPIQPTPADAKLTLERPSSSANSQNFYKQFDKSMTKEQQPLNTNSKNDTLQINKPTQPISADAKLTLERPSSSVNSQNFYKQLGKSMTKEQQPLSINDKNNTQQTHNHIQSTSADATVLNNITSKNPLSKKIDVLRYKFLDQLLDTSNSKDPTVLDNTTSKNTSSTQILHTNINPIINPKPYSKTTATYRKIPLFNIKTTNTTSPSYNDDNTQKVEAQNQSITITSKKESAGQTSQQTTPVISQNIQKIIKPAIARKPSLSQLYLQTISTDKQQNKDKVATQPIPQTNNTSADLQNTTLVKRNLSTHTATKLTTAQHISTLQSTSALSTSTSKESQSHTEKTIQPHDKEHSPQTIKDLQQKKQSHVTQLKNIYEKLLTSQSTSIPSTPTSTKSQHHTTKTLTQSHNGKLFVQVIKEPQQKHQSPRVTQLQKPASTPSTSISTNPQHHVKTLTQSHNRQLFTQVIKELQQKHQSLHVTQLQRSTSTPSTSISTKPQHRVETLTQPHNGELLAQVIKELQQKHQSLHVTQLQRSTSTPSTSISTKPQHRVETLTQPHNEKLFAQVIKELQQKHKEASSNPSNKLDATSLQQYNTKTLNR